MDPTADDLQGRLWSAESVASQPGDAEFRSQTEPNYDSGPILGGDYDRIHTKNPG